MKQERKKIRTRWIKPVIIICVGIMLATTAGIFLWIDHINKQRAEMESNLEAAVTHMEQGAYDTAQTEAKAALSLAQKLRDDDAADKSETIINLTAIILFGNEFYDAENYNAAIEEYMYALDIAKNIESLHTGLLEQKITTTEMYIEFFSLVESAEIYARKSEYDAAISIYEKAKTVASSLIFTEGITITESGIEEMHRLIIRAKRIEAAELLTRGDEFFDDNEYMQAIGSYYSALEIYLELDDHLYIILIMERLELSEQKLAEASIEEQPSQDDTPGDPQGESGDDEDEEEEVEVMSNYQHNLGIDFDLNTLIDHQNRRPANQIKMGSTEGMNEGWYNGCGWVATYNALNILGDPKHPAEIVRYFEENRGTVFGGLFGTYPNAIEGYLKSLGYSVDHTIFPQITLNIDNEIKASRVSILAYAHTSAAHYVTIVYNEEIDKFIVYNDSFARARSAELDLTHTTNVGAAIDSVTALIKNTRSILFSFSLIVVS